MPRQSCSGQAAKRLALGLSSLLCFATVSVADPPPAATGAKVDESKVAKIYYVDPAGADAADDDKHGTQDSPFLTLKHAVDTAVHDKDANVGAKVIIAPGTYRESIDIPAPAHADTDAPLVIEAAERDQTIIDAADTAGWEAATWKTDGKQWVHPWPSGKTVTAPSSNRATTERIAASVHRSELVFFNNSTLRQVETPSALVPGTFCLVQKTDRKGAAEVRLLPPEDVEDTASGMVSVSERTSNLEVSGRRNLVVRGLCFQHASDLASKGEISGRGIEITGSFNVLIEDVLSQWNNGPGLYLSQDTNITLRRVRLIHDGSAGLAASSVKNLLAEDCETSFNDFRGEWTGTYDPQGPAGVVATRVHGSTWRRQRAVANFSRGLCWETDCTDLLVEDAVVRDNLFSGLLIENCVGPSTVRGCLISGNRILAGVRLEVAQPAAVSFEASPDVTLENNVIAGNFMPQLGLRDVAERTDGTNFETGAKTTLRAERHVYRHNAFWGADAGQVLCNLPVTDRTGKSDFAFYYGTLDSDENCFWNPASAEVFCTYDHAANRRPGMSLAGWRTFLMAHAGAGNGGQGDRRPEAGSLWQDPLFMEPVEGDYRLEAQSPLIDWGLPSDEGAVAQ